MTYKDTNIKPCSGEIRAGWADGATRRMLIIEERSKDRFLAQWLTRRYGLVAKEVIIENLSAPWADHLTALEHGRCTRFLAKELKEALLSAGMKAHVCTGSDYKSYFSLSAKDSFHLAELIQESSGLNKTRSSLTSIFS